MAFFLPKLSAPPPLLPPHPKLSPNASTKPLLLSSSSSSALLARDVLREKPPALHQIDAGSRTKKEETKKQKDDFYLNLGVAVRTLRDDLPNLFSQDLNYDIYRDDITFIDSLNTFQGIENYKLIFWALRFHGRILFREIGLEIFRVWQPSENVILIRWELQGVPRVPWEAQGRFQGTSRYKLDRNGKIYEHKVDNLAVNFPRAPVGPATVMDLVVAACPPSPNLTFWGDLSEGGPWSSATSSWVELYRAVRGTLERQGPSLVTSRIEGLVGCS
ncbi:uncharacterized protein [Typha angustifolia]|uniref:uncharacterized protein n=1 Tax=Typha angustifolia TaxID=59011 RepID=UPI003C2D901B